MEVGMAPVRRECVPADIRQDAQDLHPSGPPQPAADTGEQVGNASNAHPFHQVSCA
jgi:hypothetical protein